MTPALYEGLDIPGIKKITLLVPLHLQSVWLCKALADVLVRLCEWMKWEVQCPVSPANLSG